VRAHERERVRQLITTLDSVLETYDECLGAFRCVLGRLRRVPGDDAVLTGKYLVDLTDRERSLRSARAWLATVRTEFHEGSLPASAERERGLNR
jgi:hypothetical protein